MDLLLCPASLEWVEYYRLQLRQENRRMHQRFYLFIYYFIFYFSPFLDEKIMWKRYFKKSFFFFFLQMIGKRLIRLIPTTSLTHTLRKWKCTEGTWKKEFYFVLYNKRNFFCNLKENCKRKKFQQLKNKKIEQKIAYGSVRLFILII